MVRIWYSVWGAVLCYCGAVVLAAAANALPFAPDIQRYSHSYGQEDVQCLADTIYHESRGEPLEGRIAVAEVVMRRVEQRGMGVCEVVYQPWQFSWTHEVSWEIDDGASYSEAFRVAERVMNKNAMSKCYGANHYHTDAVSPSWSEGLEPCVIGRHLFFSL